MAFLGLHSTVAPCLTQKKSLSLYKWLRTLLDLASVHPSVLISHYSPAQLVVFSHTGLLAVSGTPLTSGSLHLLYHLFLWLDAISLDKHMTCSLISFKSLLKCYLPWDIPWLSNLKSQFPSHLSHHQPIYPIRFLLSFSPLTYHFWHTLYPTYFIFYGVPHYNASSTRAGIFIWLFECSVNMCWINVSNEGSPFSLGNLKRKQNKGKTILWIH